MTVDPRSWTILVARCSAPLLCVLLCVPARAEQPEGSAESFFLEARKLMKAGDCAAALPLLERSHALEPTIGTSLNMGICAERLGKLTRATEHFEAVLQGSSTEDERRMHAERALRALSLRTPRVVLEFDESRHTLERATLDGAALSKLRPNEPYPLDPGRHEMEVVLKGELPQIRAFDLAERQTYTWVLAASSAAERPTPLPAPAAANHPTVDAASTRSEAPWRWTTRRIGGVVATGAAVAAFATGTGFALSAKSIHDSADPYCQPNNVCATRGIELRDRALDHGRIATIGFTVGITAALAATTLWLMSSGSSHAGSPRTGLGVAATLSADSGSVLLRARY